MKALILTGGKGTRLRPYTAVLPKPLMPVGDFSILEILLRQLKHAGVTEVILAVNYMSHLFEALFQDGGRIGLPISYSLEQKPLGTAGPIASVLDRLDDDFFVLNGDLLTAIDYPALMKAHKNSKRAATIAVSKRQVKIDYGVIEIAKDGTLQAYNEKPSFDYHVSMGINVFNKEKVTPYLKVNEHLDIPTLIMRLKNDGHPVNCHKTDCLWLDIGRPDDYELANETFQNRRSELLPDDEIENSNVRTLKAA